MILHEGLIYSAADIVLGKDATKEVSPEVESAAASYLIKALEHAAKDEDDE